MDDMLIFGTWIDIVCKTKAFLAFKIDMWEASVVLGVRIFEFEMLIQKIKF